VLSLCDDKSHCKDLSTDFQILEDMLHWTLGNVTAEIKILMERFTCFISSDMFENGKTYHS
jgi:hypothetical protein